MDDQIRYSIANSDYVPFSINYFNGTIMLIETLDYENVKKYVIQIQARDEREFAENISFVNVTVEVLDVPDNVPVIRNSQFDIYINSNLGIGYIVYIVDACDIDSNTTLQYALSGLDRQYFDIDHFGVIRLSTEFGSKKEFSISVTVADDMAMTTSASFSFYIDSEGAFPAFKQLIEPKITVYENVTDYFIMQFETKNVSNGHRYSIAAGDCFEDFEIDSISGKLFVKHVDRERIPKFHLFIAVSDMNVTPMHTSYIEVTVEILDSNDNKPRFEQAVYKASLKENELKADVLLRVTAFDDDLGSNARIHYSIIEGNIGDAFRIDPITGDLRNAIPLDRETIDKYRLIIEARDSGEPPLLDIRIVDVSVLDENDNPPRFSKLLNVQISEGTKIRDVVFKIKTTDPDSNENSHNTYSIIAESQEKEIFVINSKTGYITLGKSLDRESQDRYRMKVVVNDGLFSVSTTLTITVTDVNDNAPIFSQPLYTFEIDRNNSSFGSIIGKVSAQDLDSGENSTIQFGISPESALFEVDPLTGEIMVLRSPTSFDESEFHIKVYASDNGVPPKSGVTNVRIVLCGSIEKVSARDLDSKESVKKLSRETIEVSARDLDTTEPVENLSRETIENDNIKFSIMPVDHNSIIVNLEEASSSVAPTFRDKNVIFELSRRSKNSTIVGILPVDNTSSSSSSSRKPVFFIENNNFLRVLQESGEIILSNAIGANMNNTFSIEAIVKNSMLRHVPPSICQVRIMFNDYAPTPVFPEEIYIVSFNETTSKELLRFNFIMPDDAEFKILGGNDGKLFCISKTGSLTLCGAPTQREHYYTLGLGILSNGYIRSQTTVEIHFTNTINTKFRIYPGNRMAWVRENISPGIRFLRLKPHLDDQQNSNFIFKIVDEEMSEFFQIDANSGVLSTKQTFDREKRDAYLIPIAIHRNETTQPEIENITVFIDDVDDNPPEQSPIKVFVFSEESEFFGNIDQLYPPDEDSISSGACSIADETPSLNIKFGESCAGVFESVPSGKHHIKLHYRENDLLIKYDMELLVTWLNEKIIDNAILIEFLGTDRMAAEFLSRLRVSLQEMV
uniref:Cadherin domain-containing protein n=1 Tax=Acrobeloides nanus TaxID=290746 RepID=A0A914D9M8_9BILA